MIHFKKKNNKKGFIKIVLLVIIALVILKYVYDIDIIGFLTTGKIREYLDKFYDLAVSGWKEYSEFIIKIWNNIIDFLKNFFDRVE